MALSLRKRIGPGHPLFRTGKGLDGNGYVMLTSKIWGPNKDRREHCVVMEQIVGRRLRSGEVVHHVNGNRSDNRPENLTLETRASHNRIHGRGRLLACSACGAERWYGPALIAKMNYSSYQCRPCRFGRNWNNRKKER